jgi:hypothetical protein
MKHLVLCIGVVALCTPEALSEITSFTQQMDGCVNQGSDPSCFLEPCPNRWDYMSGSTLLQTALLYSPLEGWGWLQITAEGSSFQIHPCLPFETGIVTVFMDDLVIILTTPSCKVSGI